MLSPCHGQGRQGWLPPKPALCGQCPPRWPLLLSGTAGRSLRASTSYALNQALHHVAVGSGVCPQISPSQDSSLHTPPGTHAEPPKSPPTRDPAHLQSPGPPWRAPEGTGIGLSGAHSCRKGKRWPNRRAHTRWPSPLAPAP